jgi:hypothetical protein
MQVYYNLGLTLMSVLIRSTLLDGEMNIIPG